MSHWRPDELATLIAGYDAGVPLSTLMERLPGRSYRSIQVKAHKLRADPIPDLPHLWRGRALSGCRLFVLHAGLQRFWAARRAAKPPRPPRPIPRHPTRSERVDARFAAAMAGRVYD